MSTEKHGWKTQQEIIDEHVAAALAPKPAMSRKEFMKRWLDRDRLGWPSVRIRQEHTHIDSFYKVTVEGGVEAVQLVGDKEGSTDVLACIGGNGREGNGLWVTLFSGSEVTSLGLSKHLKITVELIEES